MSNFNPVANKKLRYGGYAALISAVFCGVLIILNLVAGQIPLKFDLSEHQLFTLSTQTLQVLKGLRQEVRIYGLYPAGKEDVVIAEILGRYRDHCGKISLKFIDPDKNPGFVKQFATDGKTPGQGSLIITAGTRFKVVAGADLFNYDTGNYGQQQVSSLAVEQRVTGAIQYLRSGKNPVIYLLEGHGEPDLPAEVVKQLDLENYTVRSLNLLTKPVPKDAAILMVFAPNYDLAPGEIAKIREYLARSGRAIILPGLLARELPNLQSLLGSYGVSLQHLVVVEGDSAKSAGNPLFLLPDLQEHSIDKPLRDQKLQVLLPQAQSIQSLAVKKQSTTIEPLLTTSNLSWGKTNLGDTSLEKGGADRNGPFQVAVAITDQGDEGAAGRESKLVVVADAAFLSPDVTSRVPGNMGFLLNSLGWLQDRRDNLAIQPKSLYSLRLQMNGFQMLLFAIVVVAVIPLAVLGIGITVWLRRRHL